MQKSAIYLNPRLEIPTMLLMICMLTAHGAPMAAQSTAGTIRGAVSDESGAVTPGATITLTNVSTGTSRTRITDAEGRYAFLNLPPAPYELTVELAGFTTAARRGLELAVSQRVDLDFTLTPAGIAAAVTVTADSPVVNTTTPELGGRMDPRSLTELPINGRDYTRFSLLVPGAIARTNYIADLTFNGLHSVHNSYSIDGIDASRVDQPYMANGYERGARLLTGSLDSIQEFQVNTGVYQAEFGRASGSVVNVVTKSGGNVLHGTAFEFLRNSAFDARNFFVSPTQSKPLYILNQFGGNISGPIARNKTFYFFNYEGSRQQIGITGSGTVPSEALRQRALATSPGLTSLLATIPAGTERTANPDVDRYTAVQKSVVREDTGSVRIDHRFSNSDSMFGRVNVNDTHVVGALFGVVPNALARDQFQDVPVRTTNIVVQQQHIFPGTMVNEVKFGVQRWASQIISNTPHPQTTIVGLTIQPGTFDRSFLDGTMYQWTDNLSFTRGNHALKTGIDYRRIDIDNGSIDSSTIVYESLDDFVRNSVSSATLTPGNTGRETFGQNCGIYFQDDRKPITNVTLNLGIGYEYYAALRESQDRTEPFNMETGDLAPPGSPYYRPDRNNFGPRVGVAWSPFPSDRTIVRGGFGIYYQAYPTGFGAYSVPFNNIAGSTSLVRAQVPELSLPLAPFVASGTTPLPTVAGFDPNRRDIYTEQWTTNVQQELGTNTMVQLAYVGNRGHNLRRNWNINFFDPARGARPNPKFADINIEGNTGKSLYHALQASFKRRLSNGAAFDIEYTYGHALDDVQDQALFSSQPQDNNNLAAEWGNSSGDIRHNLAFNFIYDLPFGPDRRVGRNTAGLLRQLIAGWQIGGPGIVHTGIPFTVELGGTSFGNFNFVNQRPDHVPGVSSVPENRTITNWLNPAAFAEPRPGTFGNLGRNTEYGPGFAQVDLSLLKTSRVRESHALQFRAEFFNVLNRPNFANPVAQLRSPASFGLVLNTFGRTLGLGTSRQIQFALKYMF